MEEILNKLVKDNVFYSKESFEFQIEKSKHLFDESYIDTISDYCEKNEIDVEDIATHISPSLYLKVANEAYQNRLLKHKIQQVDFNSIF